MAMIELRAAAIALAASCLAACGHGGYDDGHGHGGDHIAVPATTTEILSDSALDGDIEQTGTNSFTLTQGMAPNVQSVFAGIDPTTATEFRSFLHFQLSGAGGVPSYATIDAAYLDVFVKSLNPITATLPIRVELVSFQPPTMLSTDFDRTLQPALASVRVVPSISRTDVGTNVSIDVTPLMIEAQRRKLVYFQVRIMEDLGVAIPALLEIDDTTGTNRQYRAPLLTVTYF